MQILIGEVNTVTGDERNKRLNGIRLVLATSGYCEKEFVILGGADEENHRKLTEVEFELTGNYFGFNNIEDFRQAWKDGTIDGVPYIEKEDIKLIKESSIIKGN